MIDREKIEENEKRTLQPFATLSFRSMGRTLHGEEFDDYRGCFQRDRDRIIYSTAFKRLQYKTQVFVVSEGDFYRTRLTHTLEVAQHARTLARALGVNEDLCEAISYAHDLGHTPFGHAGEAALDELLKDQGGFEHNFQSLRIVDSLEKRYPDYDGLNLCYETREGIAMHTSTYDNPKTPPEFKKFARPSLEAQIVNVADPLAYCAHDVEDALNAGFISMDELLRQANSFLRRILETCSFKYQGFQDFAVHIKSRLLVRTLIELSNAMVIEETKKNIAKYEIKTAEDVRKTPVNIVSAPPKEWEELIKLKKFLFERVYRSPQVCIMNEKGIKITKELFLHIEHCPEMLPRITKERFDRMKTLDEKRRIIADYISGMTDRYAMDLFEMMFEPYVKVMMGFRD